MSVDRIIFSLSRASFKFIVVLGIKLLEIYSCLFGTDDVRVGAYRSTYIRGGGGSLGRTATSERGGGSLGVDRLGLGGRMEVQEAIKHEGALIVRPLRK